MNLGITGFRNVVVLLMSGCKALDMPRQKY